MQGIIVYPQYNLVVEKATIDIAEQYSKQKYKSKSYMRYKGGPMNGVV